jgi:hypothetical protein
MIHRESRVRQQDERRLPPAFAPCVFLALARGFFRVSLRGGRRPHLGHAVAAEPC